MPSCSTTRSATISIWLKHYRVEYPGAGYYYSDGDGLSDADELYVQHHPSASDGHGW